MARKNDNPKRIFEPENQEETIKGWLLHCHKGRARHDRAARRLDRLKLWLGGIATVFAAVVGASIFSTLKENASDTWKLVIAMISIASAIFSGLSSFLNLAERAEKHRSAGVRYKAIIRKLESRLSKGLDNSTDISTELEEIEKSLDELENNAPIVPEKIYLIVDNEWNEGVEIITKADDFYKRRK